MDITIDYTTHLNSSNLLIPLYSHEQVWNRSMPSPFIPSFYSSPSNIIWLIYSMLLLLNELKERLIYFEDIKLFISILIAVHKRISDRSQMDWRILGKIICIKFIILNCSVSVRVGMFVRETVNWSLEIHIILRLFFLMNWGSILFIN